MRNLHFQFHSNFIRYHFLKYDLTGQQVIETVSIRCFDFCCEKTRWYSTLFDRSSKSVKINLNDIVRKRNLLLLIIIFVSEDIFIFHLLVGVASLRVETHPHHRRHRVVIVVVATSIPWSFTMLCGIFE